MNPIAQASLPIGVFDSGVGGLTVASAIRERLPGESLLYFGDTAHLPYGDKSEAAIQSFSVKITRFLLDRGIKALVIACNSASASAFHLVREFVNHDIPVLNVIDPVVAHVAAQQFAAIGLIATRRTVRSGIYAKKLAEHGRDLKSLETPLLAPMVEEGLVGSEVSQSLLKHYLANPVLQGIDSLILGCTHFPLLAGDIQKQLPALEILDSSKVTASALALELEIQGLLNNSGERKPDRFFVSDYTESFQSMAKAFFGQSLDLEQRVL